MVNGTSRMSTRDLIAQIERGEREAAVEAEVQRRLEEELARERAEGARLAEERMIGVKRSQLTAKQKAEIIRSRGIDFYNALDWA